MMNLRDLSHFTRKGAQWPLAALALLTTVGIGLPTQAQGPPPTSAPPVASTGVDTSLSLSVQQQIKLISLDKATWTLSQQKLSSALIYAARIDRGQVAVPGVPTLREPNLERDMVGRVKIDIRGVITPELLQTVQGMGGTIVSAYPKWNAMQAWLTTGWIESLAQRPEVRIIRPADRAISHTGSVTSQGVNAHLATTAHGYGATGGFSKIGVISDSVKFKATSIATGNLPSTLQVLSDYTGTSAIGEGTAMLEIIYDMAPDAQLAFATGLLSLASMAQAVLDLAGVGCDIIVDDIGYFAEYPFQDDLIAQAVDKVASQGVAYFSAMGNERGSIWEGDFKDGGTNALVAGNVHRFPSNRLYDTTTGTGFPKLYWSDPGLASANDYDLYVLDAGGTVVVDGSFDFQTGTQDPYEGSTFFADPGERLLIVLYSGKARALRLYTYRAALTESTTGDVWGHAAAVGALGIAAVDASLASPFDFSVLGAGLATESFSSMGSRRLFYNSDGSPITPGNYLFATNGGIVRNKPDFTAADGVSTSVTGFAPFYGTSAAAPHAAAMLAQMRSLDYFNITSTTISYVSGLNEAEVWTTLRATAIDAETPGWDLKAGAGVLMIGQATDALVHFIRNLSVNAGGDNVTFSWTTLLPSDTSIELSQGPTDPNPITYWDPTPTTLHSVTLTGLDGGANYDYLASSGSESGAVFNQVSGKFRTELVIPTLAVLLNKSSSIWQLRVTLVNQGTATATNVVIDGMVLNATNTTTRLPVVTPTIVGGSSKDLIFTYNRMRLLGVLNARITGTYTTPKGVTIRFSKVLPVQIL